MGSLDQYVYGFYSWMKHIRSRQVVNFFALYGSTPQFRWSAISCAPDEAVLKRIVLEERENGAAVRIFQKIRHHDAPTLRKLSRYTWNPRLRQMAINKLEHITDAKSAPPEKQYIPPTKEGVSFAGYLAKCNAEKHRYDWKTGDLLDCLLYAGANEQKLLHDFARGGKFAPKYYDGTEASPDEWQRVLAVCNPNLTNPALLKALTLLGGVVGLAAYARGADILDANEILLLSEDIGITLAAADRANDMQALRTFADDTTKPYAARMKAYAKLGDRENLRRCVSKPAKYHRSTWKCGYDMDSSNYAVIRACTDKATLINLYGTGPNDLVARWFVRIASAEEDRQSFTPPKRGRVPEEYCGGILAEDMARCEAVCRSLDSKEITNALSVMASRRDMLFVCAAEGMAFCRGRAAHMLCVLPDTQAELCHIALNEENPYVVRRVIDGIDDMGVLRRIIARNLDYDTCVKAEHRLCKLKM